MTPRASAIEASAPEHAPDARESCAPRASARSSVSVSWNPVSDPGGPEPSGAGTAVAGPRARLDRGPARLLLPARRGSSSTVGSSSDAPWAADALARAEADESVAAATSPGTGMPSSSTTRSLGSAWSTSREAVTGSRGGTKASVGLANMYLSGGNGAPWTRAGEQSTPDAENASSCSASRACRWRLGARRPGMCAIAASICVRRTSSTASLPAAALSVLRSRAGPAHSPRAQGGDASRGGAPRKPAEPARLNRAPAAGASSGPSGQPLGAPSTQTRRTHDAVGSLATAAANDAAMVSTAEPGWPANTGRSSTPGERSSWASALAAKHLRPGAPMPRCLTSPPRRRF